MDSQIVNYSPVLFSTNESQDFSYAGSTFEGEDGDDRDRTSEEEQILSLLSDDDITMDVTHKRVHADLDLDLSSEPVPGKKGKKKKKNKK